MHYAIDPTAAPGSKSVAGGGQGFDVNVHRKIYEHGKLIREDDFFTLHPGEPDDGVRPRQQAARSLHHPCRLQDKCRPARGPAATLRLAVFPRSSLLTDMLLVLEAPASSPSPRRSRQPTVHPSRSCAGQTFAVVLVGASFSSLLAVASLGVYIFVGALGAVYADHSHGWDVLTGPTGGYIIELRARGRADGLPRA